MSSPPRSELPPAYGDCANALEKVLPPVTLYVAGRFIHSSDPHAPPVYELSHSIGFLKEADRNVRVERLDYTVKNNNGVAQMSTRKKHIYNLKHPTLAEWSTYEYFAETVSRDALCGFALESSRIRPLSSNRCYRVLRTSRGPPPERKLIGTEVLFTAAPPHEKYQKAVAFEWTDAQGQLVAREVDEDGLLRLVVGVEMASKLRDALTTAWIARVWWGLARGQHKSNRWEDAKRVLNTNNPELTALSRGGRVLY